VEGVLDGDRYAQGLRNLPRDIARFLTEFERRGDIWAVSEYIVE
jgi:hypothetical protein